MPTSREFLASPACSAATRSPATDTLATDTPATDTPATDTLATYALASLLAASVGCAGSGSGSMGAMAPTIASTAVPAQSETAINRSNTEQSSLVAMLDGQAIEWSELRTPIAELAGQQVLRDAVLDIRLMRQLRERSLVIDADAITREESLLLETLSPNRERAVELLGAIRLRQGLGPTRFAALLRRNAGLRALIARDVRVDETGIANAFDMLHGTKRVARLAVLTSLPDAERFINDVKAGRPFVDLAVERSLDEGAARGGLLAPIARRDPSYPEGLRAALYATAIGGISAPVLDNGRFFVVTVLEERPGDGTTLEASRSRCEEVVRRSQERLLMDALARELSALEGVTIFDRGFDPPIK